MDANIEVAVGIGSSHFVQLLFLLPVLVAAIFKLGRLTRATSGNADSAISKSRMTQKVAIEVESRDTISYRSNAIFTSGLVAAILNFASRRTSANQCSK
jgi:hypothetical protein